jgi:hypothetical protein
MLYQTDHGGAAVSVEVMPATNGGATPFGIENGVEWHYYQINDHNGQISHWDAQWDVGLIALGTNEGNQTGWFGMDPYAESGTYSLTGYPAIYRINGQPMMTDDSGQANADGYYWTYDYAGIQSNPGNSGGPLWYQGADGPYVVGVCSTTSWAADLYQTRNDLMSWINSDASYANDQAASYTLTADSVQSESSAKVTDFPAVAVEASMYGAVGSSDEITSLTSHFLPAQVQHAIANGLDSQIYSSEVLGLAFTFGNETGSTAFATNFGPGHAGMPNSTAGDAAFAAAAAKAIFGEASTDNLAHVIDGWVANWKGFYSSHGIPGIHDPSATQVDLAARGAAWGDAVGVALANDLGPLKGQVSNFLIDAAQGTAIYSASLLSQPAHADLPPSLATSADPAVQLTGIGAHVDHFLFNV